MAGERVAALLDSSWRAQPTPPTLSSDEIASLAPLCVSLGAAPLAWRKLRSSPLVQSPAGALFHDAFRRAAIDAVRQQRVLKELIGRFRADRIDAVVVKGWAIARQYPMPGLRQYCDHDLCVQPRDVTRARAIVGAWLGTGALADIHEGFVKLDTSLWSTLLSRSIRVDCDDVPVTVLAPEDHLRVLCRHLLYHGAARPIWLVDVAVAVETRPPGFDWSVCLGPSRRVRQWIVRSLQLAHEVLGASIEETPAALETSPLPRWVVPAVLDSWSRVTFGLPKLGHSLDHPNGLFSEVRRHWPNALQATFAVRGPLNGLPRLPFQIAACVPGAVRATTDALQRYFRA